MAQAVVDIVLRRELQQGLANLVAQVNNLPAKLVLRHFDVSGKMKVHSTIGYFLLAKIRKKNGEAKLFCGKVRVEEKIFVPLTNVEGTFAWK